MSSTKNQKPQQTKGVSSSEQCSVRGIGTLSPKSNSAPKPTKKGK